MSDITLWNLEKAMVELIAMRDCAETPAEQATIDLEITRYVVAEVAKVDGIRSMLRYFRDMKECAERERDAQNEFAQHWAAKYDRLKRMVENVMDATGQKRIEGRTGKLLLKGNGGVQALEITDETLIPDEMCWFEVRMRIDLWKRITKACEWCNDTGLWDELTALRLTRSVDNGAVRKALQQPCTTCQNKNSEGTADIPVCLTCAGSGLAGVPGAHLAPRGQHLEVK